MNHTEEGSFQPSGLLPGTDTIYEINQPSESPTKLGFMARESAVAAVANVSNDYEK